MLKLSNKIILFVGILVGIIFSMSFHLLHISFDLTCYYPQIQMLNHYCEKYTTKNIIELGIILLIVVPLGIIIIKERNR